MSEVHGPVTQLSALRMKKSDPGKLAFKGLKTAKVSKSPNLPKKPGPEAGATTLTAESGSSSGSKNRNLSGGSSSSQLITLTVNDDSGHSCEELDGLESTSCKENGSSTEAALDDMEAHYSDSSRTRQALEHLQNKVIKVKEHIKGEQNNKESNVNEYLRLASNADKQQLQRIKTVFEKKNQKSAQTINHLQKKLETYHKKVKDLERYGAPSSKQPKERFQAMSQGLNTIVSKPREFAQRIIKNKSGSADNINQLKLEENHGTTEEDGGRQGGGTLPASFKYSSDDDNSSLTSGSGFGAHSSPHSASQNISQQFTISPESILQPIQKELQEHRDETRRLHDTMQRILDEFDSYKTNSRNEVSQLRSTLEDERYRFSNLEEQILDMTQLHQNEMSNLRQDISSMEEKIEYQLDERTRDIHDVLENFQTRITKMELQQQQQQIISMEMVDNVTFRTLLTKLINVVLALIAVILVCVSTTANLLAPFLTTRARILTTILALCFIIIIWRQWDYILDTCYHIWTEYGL